MKYTLTFILGFCFAFSIYYVKAQNIEEEVVNFPKEEIATSTQEAFVLLEKKITEEKIDTIIALLKAINSKLK